MFRFLVPLLALVTVGAAPPASRDWRTNGVESASGWTFGKPTAPLLVEYGSLGCPHCGHFAEVTGTRIDALVKAGKLRFAYRPYLIFRHDLAGNVLARCVPAARRLAFIEGVYAAQADSKARLATADADETRRAQRTQAEFTGPVALAKIMAEDSGLKALASGYGLDTAAADRCLADQANYDWVNTANLTGRASGIAGTPTYLWKGQKLPETLTPEQLLAALPQ